jgi:hypothetical protein
MHGGAGESCEGEAMEDDCARAGGHREEGWKKERSAGLWCTREDADSNRVWRRFGCGELDEEQTVVVMLGWVERCFVLSGL